MATMAAMAKEPMTTCAAAITNRTGANRRSAARRRTFAAVAATMAEIRGLGATAERHHQNNTVHRFYLLQKQREANPRIMGKPLGLEPSYPFQMGTPLQGAEHGDAR